MVVAQPATVNSHNTTTNSHNSHTTNNITLNFHGGEKINHILNNKPRLDGYAGRCYMAIPAFIKDAMFDPAHPENTTVRMPNRRDKFMQVYTANGWCNKVVKDVVDGMIGKHGEALEEHVKSDNCAIKLQWVRNNFLEMFKACLELPYDKQKRATLENEVLAIILNSRDTVASGSSGAAPVPEAETDREEAAALRAQVDELMQTMLRLQQENLALLQGNEELQQTQRELHYELDEAYKHGVVATAVSE